jgi:hypothetical protein
MSLRKSPKIGTKLSNNWKHRINNRREKRIKKRNNPSIMLYSFAFSYASDANAKQRI